MTQKEDLVSIILLNWNGKKVLHDCLESIKNHTSYKNIEIILTDQGSTDGSIEMLEKEYPYVTVIKNPANVGIPKGTNQGFAIAKGKYFFIMSNDIVATDGWLENSLELMKSDNRIASVGSTLVSPKDAANIKPINKWKKKASVCSAAMLMKRKAFEHLGNYDEENFSPYGGDETDWNLRAWSVGYKVIETQNSVVIHIGSHDTKKQNPRQYLLLNEHRLKSILFSAPLTWMIKLIPGLALIFINSFSEGTTLTLLQSYFNNLKNWRLIFRERAKRQALYKRLKKEQEKQGEYWY